MAVTPPSHSMVTFHVLPTANPSTAGSLSPHAAIMQRVEVQSSIFDGWHSTASLGVMSLPRVGKPVATSIARRSSWSNLWLALYCARRHFEDGTCLNVPRPARRQGPPTPEVVTPARPCAPWGNAHRVEGAREIERWGPDLHGCDEHSLSSVASRAARHAPPG